MISKNHPIWGFKAPLNMPKPFDKFDHKTRQITFPSSNIDVRATMVQGVAKAALIYAFLPMKASGRTLPPAFEELVKGVAVGTRSGEGAAEDFFIEKESESRDCFDIILLSEKGLKGSFYGKTSKRVLPYKIKGQGGTDGTAIFLGLLLKIAGMKNSFFDGVLSELVTTVTSLVDEYETSGAYPQSVLEKIYNESLFELSYMCYDWFTNNNFCELPEDTDELIVINKSSIDKGIVGPSKNKVIFGEFQVLKVGGKKQMAVVQKKEDLKMLKKLEKLPFERSYDDFSNLEKAMIPEVDKLHIVSDEEVFIASEIMETFKDERNAVKTVMLLGSSSSGKSHLTKTMAARMKRPFASPLTCTPNMDESTLLGATLPVVTDNDKARDTFTKEDNALLDKLYASSEEDAFEIIRNNLGLPQIDEMLYDPSGSYQMMTGNEMDASSVDVVTLAQQKVSSKLASLIGKMPSGNEVTYKYYKSPLVRAIENGHMIEIQEFNVVKEAALFASLNNVFDKDSDGVLETPHGQVYRHPDFRAFYTANPDYAGCKDPHQSVIARADMVVTMNNPVKAVMKQRVSKRMEFKDQDLLDNVIDAFEAVTTHAEIISCNGEGTMRELYRFANAILRGVTPDLAIENYVINSITRDKEDKAELLEAAMKTDLFLS